MVSFGRELEPVHLLRQERPAADTRVSAAMLGTLLLREPECLSSVMPTVVRYREEAYCTGKVFMTSWIRNIDWPAAGKSVALIALIFAVFWLMASFLGV